jgi:hypothetical protein
MAAGEGLARIESLGVGGAYVYGVHADVNGPFREQAAELVGSSARRSCIASSGSSTRRS